MVPNSISTCKQRQFQRTVSQKESCLNWLEIPLINFVLFCSFFCIQFPGSLPRLKFADQNIIKASKMKQLYTNRTGDKFACFHNSIDFFGQAMLLTCRFHVRMKE